jgi:hypothetical protein
MNACFTAEGRGGSSLLALGLGHDGVDDLSADLVDVPHPAILSPRPPRLALFEPDTPRGLGAPRRSSPSRRLCHPLISRSTRNRPSIADHWRETSAGTGSGDFFNIQFGSDGETVTNTATIFDLRSNAAEAVVPHGLLVLTSAFTRVFRASAANSAFVRRQKESKDVRQ